MWKHSRQRTLLVVYGIPFILALLCRCVIYYNWLNSPIRFFHKVAGLDMMTLIEQGTKFYNGNTTFNIYRLAIALVIKLNDGQFTPPPLIFTQLCTGILCSMLVAYIALHLSGKRFIAAVAGSFIALYAPVLMYECVILKESLFLFFCLLSFCVLLKTRRKRFSSSWMILFGITITLPVLIRISALSWSILSIIWILWYIWKKQNNNNQMGSEITSNLKRCVRHTVLKFIFLSIGILIVLLNVILINYKTGNHIPYSQLNIGYILSRGASDKTSQMHIEESEYSTNNVHPNQRPSKTNYVTVYSKKLLNTFRAFEISNNLNYYFIRYLLFPLNYLIGPSFLIPLGVTGLLILTGLKRFLKKESLLFIYLISFVIPLCIFVPIARYRIILLPIFSITATIPFFYFRRLLVSKGKNMAKPLLIILLYIIILVWALPVNPTVRSGDYLSLGKALEVERKDNYPQVIKCYQMALKLNPASSTAVINLAYELLQKGDFFQAEIVLNPFNQKHPDNFKVAINYASALLGNRKPGEAEKVLLATTVPFIAKAKVNYYYHLGECKRLQNNSDDALKYYKTALRFAETLYQKRAIYEVMKRTINDTKRKN